MAKQDSAIPTSWPVAMLLPPDRAHIRKAAEELRRGFLVVFPTETVYGLGGDARNDRAVAAIFEKKGRPRFNPLIIHISSAKDAALYGEWDERAEMLARRFWPGPLTLVLRRRADCAISRLACAGLDSVALRAPSHPVASHLLQEAGLPLAGPSANPSGFLSPTTAFHAHQNFPDLPVLDGGACEIGLESSVLSLVNSKAALLRLGAVTAEEIGKILQTDIADGTNDGDIRSPGQLLSHYAPHRPLRINAENITKEESLLAFGQGPYPAEPALNLSPRGDVTEAAANLFAMLHELDSRVDVAKIAVMPIPEIGLGRAINDRLRRAAH